MYFQEFGNYIISFLRKYVLAKLFWERWILNSDSYSCEIRFGFQYDTKASIWNPWIQKVFFQIQDRPHRALYYILPSLIAAVIFNIPRYSEPMIFQHAHSCWRFDMCCFLSEICLIRFQIRSTLLCNTNFQSQISTIFSTMITLRFFDTELKIKCLDFEACNCGKMVRCVGRVENIFFTHRLNSYCYQPLFLMF